MTLASFAKSLPTIFIAQSYAKDAVEEPEDHGSPDNDDHGDDEFKEAHCYQTLWV